MGFLARAPTIHTSQTRPWGILDPRVWLRGVDSGTGVMRWVVDRVDPQKRIVGQERLVTGAPTIVSEDPPLVSCLVSGRPTGRERGPGVTLWIYLRSRA